MKEIRNDLVKIVHGDLETYTSVLFCGSGTICMDVCLNSLLKADGKILIVNNGAYSSRAAEICEYYHLPYIDLKMCIRDRVYTGCIILITVIGILEIRSALPTLFFYFIGEK